MNANRMRCCVIAMVMFAVISACTTGLGTPARPSPTIVHGNVPAPGTTLSPVGAVTIVSPIPSVTRPTLGSAIAVTPSASLVTLAGVCTSDRGVENICTVHEEGSGLVQLTDNTDPGVHFQSPTWSPDGLQILFVRLEATYRTAEIYVVAADGSSEHRLTRNTVVDTQPVWAPNGGQIAFVSQSGSDQTTFKLFLMYPDGTGVRRVTQSDDYDEAEPAWAPTGEQLVFSAWKAPKPSADSQIRVVDLDGTNERQVSLAGGNVLEVDSPGWSPDGKWIAYIANLKGAPDVITFILAGSGQSFQSKPTDTDGDMGFADPVWSPDSRRLTFGHKLSELEAEGRAWYLGVMDVASLAWHELPGKIEAVTNCWLPDSRRVAYYSSEPANATWIIDVDNAEAGASLVIENFQVWDCFPRD